MERLALNRQIVESARIAFQAGRKKEAAALAMQGFGMQKQPLSVSESAELIFNAGEVGLFSLTDASRILVRSCTDISAQEWTPQTALPPLITASNIRDVLYHNPMFHSRLSKLNGSLQLEMVRDEARLLEAASALFYGEERQKLIDQSRQSYELTYHKLDPNNPLKYQTGLDLYFFKIRHSREIDKIELKNRALEDFRMLELMLFDSAPNLLATLAARVRFLGEKLDIDDLWNEGHNTLGRLWQENPWLPNPVFEERYQFAKKSCREISLTLALLLALPSADFRAKRGRLFRDLSYCHADIRLVQTV